MWFGIVSLFPDMFKALEYGITGRAMSRQLLTLSFWNPRDYTTDKYQTVDDHPYGGGPGMLMKAPPLLAAITAAKAAAPTPAKVIYLSPQGRLFHQVAAIEIKRNQSSLVLVAGRYEGIDERVLELGVDEEWSIGDYVLTGGEIPAMAMIDTLTRLIPGAVGDEDSVEQDSLSQGLLKYPQYTRPEIIGEHRVPDVLLSGNHADIAAWRQQAALRQTQRKRPDLIKNQPVSPNEPAKSTMPKSEK